MLTDPKSVDRWRRDSQARQAIEVLWACGADPAATLAGRPAGRDRRAVEQGKVVRGAGPGQQFADDVFAEERAEGWPYAG